MNNRTIERRTGTRPLFAAFVATLLCTSALVAVDAHAEIKATGTIVVAANGDGTGGGSGDGTGGGTGGGAGKRQISTEPGEDAPEEGDDAGAAVEEEQDTGGGAAATPTVTTKETEDAKVIEITAPADPLAAAAFEFMVKHCARCHQAGPLLERERPAKGFGNVLDLDALAHDPNLIVPGNPDASRLYKQLIKKEMPYDVFYEFSGEEPTAEEISHVRDWITSLGNTQSAACTDRQPITNDYVVELIAKDLQSQPDHRIKGMRYVTLTSLYTSCVDDEHMKVYRQGLAKFLNSMSRSSDVYRIEWVDEYQTIARFNLDDLGWEYADWERLLSVYPYAAQPDVKLFDFIKSTTGTELAFIRGDWLAFAASRPPLYYDMLHLPSDFAGLQKDLGLDIERNLERFLARRAGFQISGVSRNNRLIERHAIRTGAFWTSYDFKGNEGNKSLFEHPTGPYGENPFKHDGGETIFSLPNGFNAYYLNTADGKRLNTGPTQIVQDATQKDLAVTNGISCFGCHDQGFRKARDDIRPHVIADRTFRKSVREAVEALYPPYEEMDRIILEDTTNFRAAMQRAGLDPDLNLAGVEMINALSKQYEKDVNLTFAAAEFGLSAEEFISRLEGAGGEAFRLKRRLEQGTVPRDTFEEGFKDLLAEVTDDTFAVAKGFEGKKEEVIGKKAEDPKVSRDFDLALFSDRSTYKKGALASFTVSSKQDCYLTLINVDAKGVGTVIYPNEYQKDHFLAAGKELVLPGDDAPFQFRLQDYGTETVIAVCNASEEAVDGIKHDFDKKSFTDLGDYEQYVTRSIVVEQAKPKKKGKKASVEAAETGHISGKGDVLARTAIKLEVE
ncbi:MAG: DUF4384 domain-containing protein [Hyphomicrobiaceae bacterium]